MSKGKNDNQDVPLPSQSEATLCKHPADKKRSNERTVTTTAERSFLCDQLCDASQLIERLERQRDQGGTVQYTRRERPFLHGREEPNAGATAQAQDSMVAAFALQCDGWQCKYSTGHTCNSMRTVKTTGELHRFCELHAYQAKLNQRKAVSRKRNRLLVGKVTTSPDLMVASDPRISGGITSFAQQWFASTACMQQATGADADLNNSAFLPVDMSEPDEVDAALVAHRRHDLVVEADEDSSFDESGSHSLAAFAWDSLDGIPPSDQLRMLMEDVSDGEVEVLAPWVMNFIDEACESLRMEP